MKKYLIYTDKGTSTHCIRSLSRALQKEGIHSYKYIDQFDLCEKNSWQKDAAALFFPGGRDIPYDRALKGTANQNIRSYVEDGGIYFGICAGAYYGCSNIIFDKDGPLEIIENRELQFFPGTAEGPVYKKGSFSYENESGAEIAVLDLAHDYFDKTHSYAYFNGGCFFHNAKDYSSVTVLATYSNIANNPAAIVRCSYGRGFAILSGVHPEYAYNPQQMTASNISPLPPSYSLIKDELKIVFQQLLSLIQK